MTLITFHNFQYKLRNISTFARIIAQNLWHWHLLYRVRTDITIFSRNIAENTLFASFSRTKCIQGDHYLLTSKKMPKNTEKMHFSWELFYYENFEFFKLGAFPNGSTFVTPRETTTGGSGGVFFNFTPSIWLEMAYMMFLLIPRSTTIGGAGLFVSKLYVGSRLLASEETWAISRVNTGPRRRRLA